MFHVITTFPVYDGDVDRDCDSNGIVEHISEAFHSEFATSTFFLGALPTKDKLIGSSYYFLSDLTKDAGIEVARE